MLHLIILHLIIDLNMPAIDAQQCEALEFFEQPHLSIAEVAKLINFGPAIYNCPFF